MIAYSTGLCVLWNLKNKSADRRFAHYPKDNHVSVVSLILLVAHSIMNCHPTYNRLIFECHCVHGNIRSLLIPWPLADSTTLPFFPPLHFSSKRKWRGGICSNIQLVPCICPPPVVPAVTVTAVAVWKNGSFAEHAPWQTSSACVDTKPRGIVATYIVSGDRNDPM